MNKKKICVVIVLLLILTLSLVGCVGKTVNFKLEDVQTDLNTEYNSGRVYFQMVNKIGNENELKAFFNTKYFGENTADKLTMFNEEYFKDNYLLVLCYPKGTNETFVVSDLSIKGDELFVTIKRKYAYDSEYAYSYKFITVERVLIEDAKKFSYIIISE